MTTVAIRLDGEPRGKGRPRFSRKSGRAYTPAMTQNYEAALRVSAQHVMAGGALLAGPLDVSIRAVFAIPKGWAKKKKAEAEAGTLRATKRPDVDNLAKMIDALNGVVWSDDAQISDLTIYKRYSLKPSLTVEVSDGVE